MGGGTPRVQPLCYPPVENRAGIRGSRQWEWGVASKPLLWGKAPFSDRVWGRAPSRQGNITHQSSHPPALHLLALPLPLPLRPPPLRSHWVHQPLPDIWGRNRQTDSSPCRGWGDSGEGEKLGSHQDGGPQSPAAHHVPSWHLRILWRLWRLRSR